MVCKAFEQSRGGPQGIPILVCDYVRYNQQTKRIKHSVFVLEVTDRAFRWKVAGPRAFLYNSTGAVLLRI